MPVRSDKTLIPVKQLVRVVKNAFDTPSLISVLAGDRMLLHTVLRILNPTPGVDAHILEELNQACRQENITVRDLKLRLLPAASALGISPKNEKQAADFYEILKVPYNAPDSAIRSAYRSRARELHPDTNPGADSVDFVKLAEAYRVLSKQELRQSYDAGRQKTPYWVEQDHSTRESADLRKSFMRRHRRLTLYQFAGVVVFLLGAIVFADYFFKEQALMEPPRVSKTTTGEAPRVKADLPEKRPALERSSLVTLAPPEEPKPVEPRHEPEMEPAPEPPRKKEAVVTHADARKIEEPVNEIPDVQEESPPPPPVEDPPAQPARAEDPPAPEQPIVEPLAPTEQPKPAEPRHEPEMEPAPEPPQKKEAVVTHADARKIEEPVHEIPDAQEESPLPPPVEDPPAQPARAEDPPAPEQPIVEPLAPPEEPKPAEPGHEPEMEPAPAPPQKTEEVVVAPPPLEQIEEFLVSYCGAYQELNYDLFMGYFTADAMENDQAVKDLEHQYRRNFNNLRDLSYDISVNQYVVRDDMIEVSGDYVLRWRFKKSGWKKRNGPIFLSLVQVDDDYRVKRLVYR